ncbi:MAG: hypothetical protein RR497_00530 [Oscillospiraceae bacterium]
MKKLVSAFLCIAMVLSLSVIVFAQEINNDNNSKGVDIGTSVPTNHTITIVKDEGSMVYYDGNSLKNGDKISVSRLSSPEFTIYSQDGFLLSKAVLDKTDILKNIENKLFKINSIHQDATITVNSTKKETVPEPPTDLPTTGDSTPIIPIVFTAIISMAVVTMLVKKLTL